MSISKIIRARWDDLSSSAQEHIRTTRPRLLNRWILIEGGHEYDTIDADSAEDALDAARGNVDAANYDLGRTIWIDFSVRNEVTGETDSGTEQLDPDEPYCTGASHDWQSPHEVLGGLEENPGVWGHGGGVIIRRVCAHCGAYRITDTWAQRPDTGEQGLTSIRYEDADDASRAWIEAEQAS